MQCQPPPVKAGVSVFIEPRKHRAVVRPRGEIDIANAGDVEQHLVAAADAGYGEVVLDLRDVTFMDSALMNVVVRYGQWAERAEQAFAVVPGGDGVQRLFDLWGLSGELSLRVHPGD